MKKEKILHKLVMLLPAFWAALFDMTITVVYQPNEYWNGNLNVANEANPIGAFAMKHHVLGFFIVCLFWLFIIGIVGSFLNKKNLPLFTLFVLICHTWGGSSWIMNHFGFELVMIYIFLNSLFFIKIQKYYNSKEIKCQSNKTSIT